MKIENIFRKNRTVSLGGKQIAFDENGIAEVDEKTASALLSLGGYRDIKAAKPVPKSAPAPAQAQMTPPPATGLDTLSVAALKKLAKEKNIEIGDASKKADIIAALEKAQA